MKLATWTAWILEWWFSEAVGIWTKQRPIPPSSAWLFHSQKIRWELKSCKNSLCLYVKWNQDVGPGADSREFLLCQVGHTTVESGVVQFFPGHGLPMCCRLSSIQMPASSLPSMLTTKSTPGSVQTIFLERKKWPYWDPQVSSKLPGVWIENRRLAKGKAWHKATLRVSGRRSLAPSFRLPGQCLSVGLILTCREGCRLGPPPRPLQNGCGESVLPSGCPGPHLSGVWTLDFGTVRLFLKWDSPTF